jgi:hypothetical protein
MSDQTPLELTDLDKDTLFELHERVHNTVHEWLDTDPLYIPLESQMACHCAAVGCLDQAPPVFAAIMGEKDFVGLLYATMLLGYSIGRDVTNDTLRLPLKPESTD